MKKLFSAIVLLLVAAACASSRFSYGFSCTIFSASTPDVALVGNNEDWYDKDTRVWFEPAAEGAHGAVFFGFGNLFAQGGMNDQGLFYDWVAGASSPMEPSPDKKNFYGNLSVEILKKCATVEEALAYYDQYNEPAFGYAHTLLADSTGASVLIGWDGAKNELSVKRKEGSYQIYGFGERAIPKDKLELYSQGPTVENFTEMLELAKQGDITVYSNVYDLKNKTVYLYHMHNFDQFVQFNLEDELKKGRQVYEIKSFFESAQPDETASPAVTASAVAAPALSTTAASTPAPTDAEAIADPGNGAVGGSQPGANPFLIAGIAAALAIAVTWVLVKKKRAKS